MLGTRRGRRALIGLVGTLAATAVLPAPASADHHLMLIRELYAGGSDDSFIELQMYAPGQHIVDGHHIILYDNLGTPTFTYTFPAGSYLGLNGGDQRTILIGDTNANAGNPDFADPGLNIPAAGGAACFDSEAYPDGPIDCVAWGNYVGNNDDVAVGLPATPGGIAGGTSIVRRMDRDCAGRLDGDDDVNISDTDFLTGQTPSPRKNSVTPTETNCPDTTISSGFANGTFTNATAATFNYTSTTVGATFECKLDNGSFAACNPPPNTAGPKSYPGPLGEGSHTFQVRAVSGGVPDPTPATRQWTVDTTPPDTNITGTPQDPTTSQSATFTYSSSEPTSATFRCKLDSDAEANCNTGANTQTTKSYSSLPGGPHTFTVLAVDRAGNKDPDPTQTTVSSYDWTIDRTGPDVVVDTGPTQPTDTTNSAAFTYHATEPNSTFKCRLDAGTLEDCNAPGGKSYPGPLNDGPHTFHVYGTDALGNQGPTTDYAWTVDASSDPPPDTLITKAPKRKGTKRVVKVEFTANPVTGATFECQIDSGDFQPCTSPFTTPKLKYGKHTIQVKATGPGGTDATPATTGTFKIVRP